MKPYDLQDTLNSVYLILAMSAKVRAEPKWEDDEDAVPPA